MRYRQLLNSTSNVDRLQLCTLPSQQGKKRAYPLRQSQRDEHSSAATGADNAPRSPWGRMRIPLRSKCLIPASVISVYRYYSTTWSTSIYSSIETMLHRLSSFLSTIPSTQIRQQPFHSQTPCWHFRQLPNTSCPSALTTETRV